MSALTENPKGSAHLEPAILEKVHLGLTDELNMIAEQAERIDRLTNYLRDLRRPAKAEEQPAPTGEDIVGAFEMLISRAAETRRRITDTADRLSKIVGKY